MTGATPSYFKPESSNILFLQMSKVNDRANRVHVAPFQVFVQSTKGDVCHEFSQGARE